MTLAASLQTAIKAGEVLPGDGILYRYRRLGPVQAMITRVQSRALADLPVRSTGFTPLFDYDQFTHAGIVVDGKGSIEMTSPRCRVILWPERLAGVAEIAVVRPVKAGRGELREAVWHADDDVRAGTRYPHREILLYWLWSWNYKKLHGKTPFAKVFQSRSRNVCSGSLIQWWQQSGIDLGLAGLDTWPEAGTPPASSPIPASTSFLPATKPTNSTKKARNPRAGTHTPKPATVRSRARRSPTPASGSLITPLVPRPRLSLLRAVRVFRGSPLVAA